jgi:hypothetical protein
MPGHVRRGVFRYDMSVTEEAGQFGAVGKLVADNLLLAIVAASKEAFDKLAKEGHTGPYMKCDLTMERAEGDPDLKKSA